MWMKSDFLIIESKPSISFQALRLESLSRIIETGSSETFHDFSGIISSKFIFLQTVFNSSTGSSVATLTMNFSERKGIFLIKSLSAPPIAEKQPFTTNSRGFAAELDPA